MATSINYVPSTEPDFSGPAWNNSSEYPSLMSNEYSHDCSQLEALISRLTHTVQEIAGQVAAQTVGQIKPERPFTAQHEFVHQLQAVCEMEEQAWVLLDNMRTYAGCLSSIDGTNPEAQKALSRLTDLSGKLEATTKDVAVYLTHAPEDLLTHYFAHAHVKPYEFQVRYRREIADTLLSHSEESLLARMKANGPMAFGALYDQLASSIRCQYQDPQSKAVTTIGLAQASGLLRSADGAKRRAAWTSIQAGWSTHATSAAAILNGLAGWRLEVNELRSRKRRQAGQSPLHFLDLPIHDARITRATLDAMMSATAAQREIGRRAVRAMANAMGARAQLDPADLLSPAPILARASGQDGGTVDAMAGSPNDSRLTFDKGIGLIRDAFADVDPSFGDFVDTMKKNRWIEGRQLSSKRPGAYCTTYPKSNSPRVYQTYMGSLEDVRTLAHELGHAYHFWVMRDLSPGLTNVPMTLAETASLFGETAFADVLLNRAFANGDRQSAFGIAWQNAESAAAFVLNIPARFDFEVSFYNRRKDGFVSVPELNSLMTTAWETWYGDSLSEVEKQYWMTKLHFSISSISFYNFPYTFGALFSLGIYALKKERGADFWPLYVALLRDTGRLTAEDLAKKHLDVDLTQSDFWLKSLAIMESQVRELEEILEAVPRL